MTALGLAVAVPAVLCYNWLVRRNKVAMENVRTFSADLHAVLLTPGARKAANPTLPQRRGAVMSMNVGAADSDEDEVNSTINTTPLVDVMLVLLIIFLITIPVVTQTIPVQLPKERTSPPQTKPENINTGRQQGRRCFLEHAAASPTMTTLLRAG